MKILNVYVHDFLLCMLSEFFEVMPRWYEGLLRKVLNMQNGEGLFKVQSRRCGYNNSDRNIRVLSLKAIK